MRYVPENGLSSFTEVEIGEWADEYGKELGVQPEVLISVAERYSGHPYAIGAAVQLIRAGTRVDSLPPEPSGIAASQWNRICGSSPEAIQLFQAYAILDVPSEEDEVGVVADLRPSEVKNLHANSYLAQLLAQEANGQRIYHALLATHILGEIGPEQVSVLHSRAAAFHWRALQRDPPSSYSLRRLPIHILESEGGEAMARMLVEVGQAGMIRAGEFDDVIRFTNLALATPIADAATEAGLRSNLSVVLRARGMLEEARAAAQQALDIFSESGDENGAAMALGQLGILFTEEGEYEEADRVYERVLRIFEKRADLWSAAKCYGNLGVSKRRQGRLAEAEAALRKSRELFEQVGDRNGTARQDGNLGDLYADQDDVDTAERLYVQALESFRAISDPEGVAITQLKLGVVAGNAGRSEEATEFLSEARSGFERLGIRQHEDLIDQLARKFSVGERNE